MVNNRKGRRMLAARKRRGGRNKRALAGNRLHLHPDNGFIKVMKDMCQSKRARPAIEAYIAKRKEEEARLAAAPTV